MKDKIELLMQETGCDEGEAELALELCGYEVEKALAAIGRLFQDMAVVKGRLRDEGEALYGLVLVILSLKGRSLVRARAVVSYNPAVYTVALDRSWFEFEKHLYACRLWEGSLQGPSQELEHLLASYFASPEASAFYSEAKGASEERGAEALRRLLSRRFTPEGLRLSLCRDVLDMGQFQQLGPEAARRHARPRPRARGAATGTLVLKVALEPQADGLPAGDLRAGDLVYAVITDTRDIAQYLAKLLGPPEAPGSFMVPVEAVETGPSAEVGVRVRFSLGVCGDVNLPPGIRLKVVRRAAAATTPWWKKLFIFPKPEEHS